MVQVVWRKEMEMETKETRTVEFRLDDDGDSPVLRGHAAVFNEEAEIYGFREKIDKGAFKEAIKEDDVRALFNHDPNYVLGRNTAGTLRMNEDKQGLAVEIDPPDTQFARDLAVSMKRGDITQMSFGFQVKREEWQEGKDGEPDLRIIKEARLFDVSPVTYPAYVGTDISVNSVAVRSHEAWKKEQKPFSKTKLYKRRFKLNNKEEHNG
jgi:HK97 family phage prohead protease